LDPRSSEAHNNLGVALWHKGLVNDAVAVYRRAVELKADNGEACVNLGLTLSLKGEHVDSFIVLKKAAVRFHPKVGAVRANLWLALRLEGFIQEVADEFDAARRSDDPALQNDFAWAMLTCADPKLRHVPHAIVLATRAAELAPADPKVWRTLGVARYREGHPAAAVEALRKSMELAGGGDASDWFFLAASHWKLGEKEPARRWYERAVQWTQKRRPGSVELRRFRAEVTELLGAKAGAQDEPKA
jgi:Flp pilus assembly protein TadD